jgi:hypothetical protein
MRSAVGYVGRLGERDKLGEAGRLDSGSAEGGFWSELVLDRGALGRYRLDELRDDLLIAECDCAREFRLRLICRPAR